jgi:hypothetical protein
MANPITNAVEDPFDGDSIPSTAFHHVQSTTKGGSYPDIVAPAAHNYPDTSATRTFIYLPEAIDQSDLSGSRPMTVTGSSFGNLTRVGTSPGAGEYRIPNTTTSSRPHIIEINSGQWGETISFDYYGTGTVENKPEAESFQADYVDDAAAASFKRVYTKILEIGEWNMNSNASGSETVTVAHGITGLLTKDGVRLSATIRNDANTEWHDFIVSAFSGSVTNLSSAELYADATNINIEINRATSPGSGACSIFDNTNFNATSYNRGWITIQYFE